MKANRRVLAVAAVFGFVFFPVARAADKETPETPASGEADGKKAVLDLKTALKKTEGDLGQALSLVSEALKKLGSSPEAAKAAQYGTNAFRSAAPEKAAAWAAAKFPPEAAPSGEGASEPAKLLKELKAKLDGMKGAESFKERIALLGARAGWFKDAGAQKKWADMLAGEVKAIPEASLAAWLIESPASGGAAPPSGDVPPPAEVSPPATVKEPDGSSGIEAPETPDKPAEKPKKGKGDKPKDGEKPKDGGEPPAAGVDAPEPGGDSPEPVTAAGESEPYEGFGVNSGGEGKPVVQVNSASALASALEKGNAVIQVRGDIQAPSGGIRAKGSNYTLDGGGAATIWGSSSQGQRMIELYGSNLIIRNLRLRNAGDNLGFKAPSTKVVISHVTTSGSVDDGMSVAYGAKDYTIQYCAFFGCTRSLFIKYDNPSNISLHHSIFRCQQMRGPKICGASTVDVRNIIQEDYSTSGWGSRFESGATGNCINSLFVLTGATKGRPDAALYTMSAGKVCYKGNVGRGGCKPEVHEGPEIPCAKVTTHSVEEAEKIVREKAGCLPRDEIDKAYLSAKSWTVSETRPYVVKQGPGK